MSCEIISYWQILLFLVPKKPVNNEYRGHVQKLYMLKAKIKLMYCKLWIDSKNLLTSNIMKCGKNIEFAWCMWCNRFVCEKSMKHEFH